jgi:hypothetical protein
LPRDWPGFALAQKAAKTVKTVNSATTHLLTSTHWGDFVAEVSDGNVIAVRPADGDTNPSPIGHFLVV